MRYPCLTVVGSLLISLGMQQDVGADHHLAAGASRMAPLFDGTFEGWQKLGGKARYAIEDGVVVGTSVPNTPNTFLSTKKHYGDFILEYEFLVDPRLNSGVQIRSHSLTSYHNGRVHGYQVEIDPDLKRARLWSAGIYDEARRGWLNDLTDNKPAREAFRGEQWNHIRVAARGDSIRTWINGIPAADLVDSMTLSGFIGLQVHGVGKRTDPLQIRWRNLRIEDLGTRHWEPLVQGTLAGWARAIGGQWAVVDGSLVASGSAKHPAFLVHSKHQKDVTLHLKFRARYGRGGLLVRGQDRSEDGMLQGLLVDVGGERPGSLSNTSTGKLIAAADTAVVEKWYRPGDWNDLNVSAHGSRVTIHINHREVVDRRDVGWTATGLMALVIQHDATVEFSTVEILGEPVRDPAK